MRLASVHIRNYRCLRDVELPVGAITSLIGMNGTGKSAVLRAVAAFYGEGDPPWHEDFYEPSAPIEAELTFEELGKNEQDLFQRYVAPNGQMRIARVWWVDDLQVRDALYGYHLACPAFSPLREGGTGIKELHNSLAESPEFAGLGKVARAADSDEVLREWEKANSGRCEWIRDGGKFFGWNAVGGSQLKALTVCVYVPAVREAKTDAAEGKGSALSKIADLVLREELERNPDLVALREETGRQFNDILGKTLPVLDRLAEGLSVFMSELTPGSSVGLRWREGSPALPEWPPIEARLIEDGVEGPVWAKGHGLQRAFIVSLLQQLAELSATSGEGEDRTTHTLLLIEEPELYQHPIAVRRFSRALRDLVTKREDLQVLYSTHHPEFVAFDNFDSIRRFRKTACPDGAPASEATSLALEDVARELVRLGHLRQADVTEETTRQRLRTVLKPQVSEGFFARAVVLLEGDQDQAILEGFASGSGRDLSAKGIALLPVGGKFNLDRAYIVLAGFGVPVYLVWDGDSSDPKQADKHAQANRVLAELAGLSIDDFPPSQVGERGAVFNDELETELRAAVGAKFDEILNDVATSVGLPPGRAVLKTSYGCTEFAVRLGQEGLIVPLISNIVERVWELV